MWPVLSDAIKQILLKVFKVSGGVKAVLVNKLIEIVIEKFFKPVYQWFERKIKRIDKKRQIKKPIQNYKDSKDENSFDNSFDDLP